MLQASTAIAFVYFSKYSKLILISLRLSEYTQSQSTAAGLWREEMVYFNQAKATDALLAGEKEEEQARSFPQNYATLLKIYIRVNVKGLM
jgi:hypothetical protein